MHFSYQTIVGQTDW